MSAQSCPICSRRTLEPLLQEVTMSANIDGERLVGGIKTYRCTEYGHIFFVRTKDIEEPLGTPMKKVPVKPCIVCQGTGQCRACSGTGELPSLNF